MTWGRCGSLVLDRKGLSPSVSRRSPDAPTLTSNSGTNAKPIRSTLAAALGISCRMVAYCEQGKKPIPRVVALAARAFELA